MSNTPPLSIVLTPPRKSSGRSRSISPSGNGNDDSIGQVGDKSPIGSADSSLMSEISPGRVREAQERLRQSDPELLQLVMCMETRQIIELFIEINLCFHFRTVGAPGAITTEQIHEARNGQVLYMSYNRRADDGYVTRTSSEHRITSMQSLNILALIGQKEPSLVEQKDKVLLNPNWTVLAMKRKTGELPDSTSMDSNTHNTETIGISSDANENRHIEPDLTSIRIREAYQRLKGLNVELFQYVMGMGTLYIIQAIRKIGPQFDFITSGVAGPVTTELIDKANVGQPLYMTYNTHDDYGRPTTASLKYQLKMAETLQILLMLVPDDVSPVKEDDRKPSDNSRKLTRARRKPGVSEPSFSKYASEQVKTIYFHNTNEDGQ